MYPVSGPESVDNSTNDSLGWIGRTSSYCRNQVDDIIEFEIYTQPTRQCHGLKYPARLVPDPIQDPATIWSAEADALRRANEICSGTIKVPIVWYKYNAGFYDVDPCVPSWDRVYSGDELRDIGASGSHSRNDALAIAVDRGWEKYTHIGNVPSTHEQMQVANKERFTDPLAPSIQAENKQDPRVQSDAVEFNKLLGLRSGRPQARLAHA